MKICLVTYFMVVIVAIGSVGASQPCRDDSKCGKDECCVKIWKPMGKCRPMLNKGSRCVPLSNGDYKPRCPCKQGMECIPRKIRDTKWGPDERLHRCTEVTTATPDSREDETSSVSGETTATEVVETTATEIDETTATEIDETTATEIDETTATEVDETTATEVDETTATEVDETETEE